MSQSLNLMRGIKTMDTPILKGMQIFHNFIKPHEGLQGRTPAEAAGLVVTGSDKWLTLIQNASRPNEFRQTITEESPNAD